MFWRIAKESDVAAQAHFDADWEALIQKFEDVATSTGDGHARAVEWLRSLGTMASKWAARYVWQKCTWGIHSTQRSEAFHSAIKRFLRPSMLVTDLWRHFEQYNQDSREMKLLQMLRLGDGQKAESALMVEVKGCVTPFAYELLERQWNESKKYVAGFPSGTASSKKRTYTVRLTAAFACPAPKVAYDTATDYLTDYSFTSPDLGIGPEEDPSSSGRKVVVHYSALSSASSTGVVKSISCSCQFATSWGLPACRHIFSVCSKLELQEFPNDSYGCKWRVADDAAYAALVQTMLLAPRATSVPVAGTAAKALDPQQRNSVLMVPMRQLLEYGKQSDQHMIDVELQLQGALAALAIGGAPAPAPTAKRPRNNPCAATGSAAGASGVSGQGGARCCGGGAAAPSQASSTAEGRAVVRDRVMLLKLLGSDYARVEAQDVTEEHYGFGGCKARDWLQTCVAVKWPNHTGGGHYWDIGTIVNTLSDQSKTHMIFGLATPFNFTVEYASDGQKVPQALAKGNCVNLDHTLFGKAGIWMKLQPKALCEARPAQGFAAIRPPPKDKGKGRKQGRRMAPPSGPTSKPPTAKSRSKK